MPHTIYFISHPNVEISATVPVPQWPLSELGRSRMKSVLQLPWVETITAVYCSTEQKAIDGAEILSDHLNLDYQVNPDLGENDRSSTGYLQADEFEKTADAFFASPDLSVRGWETARSAQNRIASAVRHIDNNEKTQGAIAIVSHGAVGALLYCSITGETISRQWDQPGQGGGNYMSLRFTPSAMCTWWESID